MCSNEMDLHLDTGNESQTLQHKIFFRLSGWPRGLKYFQYLDQGQRFPAQTEQQPAESFQHLPLIPLPPPPIFVDG